MKMNKNRFHLFLLFLTALIWGTAFVAQRMGAEHVGAFTYLAGRSWAAVLLLAPLVRVMDRFFARRGAESRRPKTAADYRLLFLGGALTGLMLFTASAAQQIGIAHTTASKAGFITALYVVLVPLLSIFLRKRPSLRIWGCVVLALIGLYLLCMKTDSFRLEYGDAWELACAFFFAVDILVVAWYGPRLDPMRFSLVQFLVVAVLSTILTLLVERPAFESLRLALPSILYAGIFSSGIAYTLQIFGQEGVNPTVASLVMSLESVFSALSAWLILQERMSPRELCGAALMFLAIVLSQIEFPRRT